MSKHLRLLAAVVAGVIFLGGLMAADAWSNAQAVSTTVVINEIDYDQPGTDAAEFLELKNVSSSPIDLDSYSVELVNGNAGGATNYQTIDLPAVPLAAGDYFVVCASTVTTPNCDLDASPDANLIQNGSPDAVGLRNGTSLVDAVSYEGESGAPYTEGSGTGLVDDGVSTASISRCPDGADTDQNNVDFKTADITPGATNACATPTGVRINEVDYDQPGTDAAEFLELKNVTGSAIGLDPFSVELVNGTLGGATIYQTIDLPAVTLAAGDYYVICANPATTANCDLDASPDSNLIQNGDPDAIGLRHAGTLVDTVSYEGDSGAPYTEGSGTGLVDSGVTAGEGISRCPDGVDTDQNNVDFRTAAITPGATNCGDAAPSVSSTDPANGATGVAVDANVSITFSEPVTVTGGWFGISCVTSGTHAAIASGGPTTFTLNPDLDFAPTESCTVTVTAANVSDQDTADPPDNMAGDHTFSFMTAAAPVAPTPIHDIQGSAHTSPKANLDVANVNGIVTAKRSNGFYMQDPVPDSDPATSEGIFVFTSSAPTVGVGDAVRVAGRVTEFRPGGASSANLTLTEITSPSVSVLSSGNPLPQTTEIGSGGRIPPSEVIEDDATATGNVETSGTFDPAADGIDFYESLEAMRVQVNNPVAVGPRNDFGEIFVVGDDGAHAAVRTTRGGIVIRENDFNPERIQLDNALLAGSTPPANVGDHFNAAAVGILDYDFGNFELNLTSALTTVAGGLAREQTTPQGPKQVAIATFNVENLDPGDGATKFNTLAGLIVNSLKSPDIVALEEVQDNNGPTNDAVTDASLTLNMLIAAITSAGGPTYEFRQIDPVDDQDGGEPGGNIRVAFLFRTDRGVEFIDRPGGGPTTATTVVSTPSGPQLSASPGRIDPANPAWNSSRKPLAAEFKIRNRRFFVIVNHFNSKGGDQPLFGRFQPPTRSSEVQRNQQAEVERAFIAQILTIDPNANVVTAGDFNDFEFSDVLEKLTSAGLTDLVATLPQNERYSYVFEGNSQNLDHILASGAVTGLPFEFDVVHVNAEFADQASDHDPSVLRLALNSPPRPQAGGPYTVAEGSQTTVSATAEDPDGDPVTYAWDLDNNGTFETPGQSVSFSALNLDGPGTQSIAVRATDDGGLSETDTATVNITNVAPTATFAAPATTFAGFPFMLALAGATDPSAADRAAGFTYAFDCGSGYGLFAAASSAACGTSDTGSRTVGGQIRDKDGGVTEYRATVQVVVTYASLCELVRQFSTDPKVADELCDKLAKAETAATASSREGLLSAFRNQVDAKTGTEPGKALTEAQGALLKLLSTRL